ncbi:MAG: peptidyl-prolyl cis-trans isomerase [Rhodospirillaceae bacterium]
MFDKIRESVKDSWLIKILLGALIISFGVFGIGDFIGVGGLDPNMAVRVGDRDLNVVELQQRYDRSYQNYKEAIGNQIPDSPALRRSVMDSVIEETKNSLLLENAADEAGVVVTDEQLRLIVREIDAFKDTTGNFSQITFNEVLRANNLTEPQFLDQMRAEISRNTMLRPLAAARGPGFLTDSLFTYRMEGRTADTLLVSAKAIGATAKATDDELKKIYDQNVATFMRPEYRKVSFLTLKASELVKPESFAEEEVKAYYDQNSSRYRTPEKRRVAQFVFDSKEEAEKVRALAAPGDTLAALAAKANLGEPVDLGEQDRESVIGKIMGPAYELPVNEISAPVQSDLGWHLFATTAITPGATQAYEQVIPDIRRALAEDRGLDAVYKASTEVQDALAAGTPVAEIAKNLGISHVEIEAIDQTGHDPKGAEVPGLIDREGFLSTVFSLPANGDTGLKDLPDRDGYYVAKVESITPPAPRPFDEVRNEVTAIWQREGAMTEARKIADGLAAEIGAATVMSNLETKDGKVSYGLIGPITRFGQALDRFHLVDTGRLSAQMLSKLFTAKPGEVFTADVPEGVVVARLKDATIPQPVGQLAANRDQINQSLRNAVAGDLMEQLNAEFLRRYPPEVNQSVIDTMVGTAR